MNKLLMFALSFFLFIACKNEHRKEINVITNYNIETLAICFEIAENGFWNFPFDDYQPMKELARNEFEKYKKHQAILLIDSLVSQGFWLDKMTEVMLKTSSVPNAKLIHKLDESTTKKIKDNQDIIERFINAMNAFYLDAKLEAFFEKHRSYFANVNSEVKKNLPPKHFISTMEDYYGKQNESYTLIPSPTIYHTMGFGMRIKANVGFKVFNVFGPVIMTKDSTQFGYGFGNSKEIDELTVHEFGHSFINPITELESNKKLIDKSEHLFSPIKSIMERQGYRSWSTCVAEHIVRLGEIRIALAMNDTIRANRLRSEYIDNRGFIYLKNLETSIIKYENNRDTYNSIDTYLPQLLNSLY
ncbi:DUF4932 domain-containing protein [Winogradskyella sp.]|uniref:DUF4932 domain-containing protein n=1 Tax=Winogradskyella sp. TaxID=1883156 RepID=UPI002601EE7A|nr:DUF4932 domain-containing protein [Winogradskyella sp.]